MIRNANRDDLRESMRANRFAENYFHNVRAIRANRLKPAIRNFLAPRSVIRKKGVQFGNPETIRENQAIRADSRESGHLSHRKWETDFLPLLVGTEKKKQ